MRVVDVAGADEIQKGLTVRVAGGQAVGEVGIEEFAEELRCLPV